MFDIEHGEDLAVNRSEVIAGRAIACTETDRLNLECSEVTGQQLRHGEIDRMLVVLDQDDDLTVASDTVRDAGTVNLNCPVRHKARPYSATPTMSARKPFLLRNLDRRRSEWPPRGAWSQPSLFPDPEESIVTQVRPIAGKADWPSRSVMSTSWTHVDERHIICPVTRPGGPANAEIVAAKDQALLDLYSNVMGELMARHVKNHQDFWGSEEHPSGRFVNTTDAELQRIYQTVHDEMMARHANRPGTWEATDNSA